MWISRIWEFHKTRLPSLLFVPLALYLAMVGSANQPPAQISEWILVVIISYTLISQFRLWDDLASIDVDRKKHPERVLCRVESLAPFFGLATILWGLNLWLLSWYSESASKPLAFLALCGLMLIWYCWLIKAFTDKLVRIQIGLIKYPAIAWLLSTTKITQTNFLFVFLLLLGVYLVFTVHEILHDSVFQYSKELCIALAMQMIILCATWFVFVLQTYSENEFLRTIQWTTVLIGVMVAVGLFLRFVKDRMKTYGGFVLFIIGGLVVFNYLISR